MAYAPTLRDSLPKKESYPLGRDRLDAALTRAGVECVETVYLMRGYIGDWRSGAGRVLTVNFYPADVHLPDRIAIRIHALPAHTKARVVRDLDTVLDSAAQWIRAAETSENVWRSTRHALVVRWADDALNVIET